MLRGVCGIVGGVRNGFVVLVLVLLAATVFGLYRRRRDGRLRVGNEMRLTPEDIGAPLGERATLLQFSTAFCQPCRATRRILGEVAGMVDGVAHVEVDAESRLELVRRLDVMRTPTVFVLDSQGRVVKKATGQPRKVDVIAALGETV
ncbi:thioredoxin [Carbonactinospora thermoautotrophica]|uniref:TlpA family protein disulfide reductase n=1 Tax=Carbonactinospora thermoautotrophica TaxID=1469144 RepID=UPI00082FDC0F|nr:thioredoxin family protein [Carbonactinospora thermoautotrophica]MCX9193253.1 thioredoxin [Carbonactinospora thermoautotrophica]